MNNKNKKSMKTSLNLRIMAGVYLLYIVYSLLSDWGQFDLSNKIIVAIIATTFFVFAVVTIVLSVKGLKNINQDQEKKE